MGEDPQTPNDFPEESSTLGGGREGGTGTRGGGTGPDGEEYEVRSMG